MVRWRGHRRSSNVEDRRSSGGPMKMAGGGIGLLVVALLVWLLGGDPSFILSGGGGADPAAPAEGTTPPPNDEQAQFVSAILADTEDVWNAEFERMGRDYQEPRLVLFREAVRSACGIAGSAVGPFYCPPDQQVYLDLGFFDQLSSRFGAPGDFARAYVVAHEVGHHVQNLLGISDRVRGMQRGADRAGANALSVRLELQADCLAGIWGSHARGEGMLHEGDVEEGLRAAAAIGDDALQGRAGGPVAPESFTHGTSEQRVRWFRRGLASGDVDQCDTFATETL